MSGKVDSVVELLAQERPWEADVELSLSDAKRVLQQQWPDSFAGLGDDDVVMLGVGWDNTAVTVAHGGDRLVFRFPRRQIAVELLQTEVRVLRALAPTLPVPVPHPTWEGTASDLFCWPFAGYAHVDGDTACRRRLTREQRCLLAPELAGFLRTLHDVGLEVGAPEDEHQRLDANVRLDALQKKLTTSIAVAEKRDSPLASTALTEFVATLPSLPAPKAGDAACVVHGDLYARHLLVDENAHLCGVIDWGDVHRGDPAVDLSIVFGFLPPQAHDAFFAVYGGVDDDTQKLASFRALWSAVSLVDYGADVDDEDLIVEGLIALSHLSEWLTAPRR